MHKWPESAHLRLRGTFQRGRLTVPLRTLRRVLGAAAYAPEPSFWAGTGFGGIVWRAVLATKRRSNSAVALSGASAKLLRHLARRRPRSGARGGAAVYGPRRKDACARSSTR